MSGSAAYVTGPWRYERVEGAGHWLQLEQPDSRLQAAARLPARPRVTRSTLGPDFPFLNRGGYGAPPSGVRGHVRKHREEPLMKRTFSVLVALGALAAAMPASTVNAAALPVERGERRSAKPSSASPRARSRCRHASGTCGRSTPAWPLVRKATATGSRVGVIDGGVDFTHPDLAANSTSALSCSFIFTDTPTADPQEVANGDCSNKAAVQDLQGHGTHVATTIAGRVERHRHRRRRPGGDDRRAQGVHDRRVLLRRLGRRRPALRRRPAARRRQPQPVRRPVPVLLQERGRAAGDPQGAAERGPVRPATRRRRRRRGRQRGRRPRAIPMIDEISPDWPPDTAVTREVRNNCRSRPPSCPAWSPCRRPASTTLAGYSNIGGPVDVAAPGGDAAQTPGTTFGRILAGWSSTDMSGHVGGASPLTVAPSSRRRRPLGVDQRDVDGVAPRGRRRRADPREAPELEPGAVAAAIRARATPFACPTDWPADDERQCMGSPKQNSFYGSGLANAEGRPMVAHSIGSVRWNRPEPAKSSGQNDCSGR